MADNAADKTSKTGCTVEALLRAAQAIAGATCPIFIITGSDAPTVTSCLTGKGHQHADTTELDDGARAIQLTKGGRAVTVIG